jgi:glycosyltransferase involved in cell wall biosynthesis
VKIAQNPHKYLPHIGGLEYYVCRLSRDLEKAGHDVMVLTSDIGVEAGESNRRQNNTCYFRSFPFSRSNPIIPGLIGHILTHRYDIVHCHSINTFSALTLAILKRKARLVVTVHGVKPEASQTEYFLLWHMFRFISQLILDRSDWVICLSEKEKETLIRYFSIDKEKISAIPNGIDSREPGTRSPTSSVKTILFTGRIVPVKNVERIIESVALLYPQFPFIRVVLAGPVDPRYKNHLENYINSQGISQIVTFTGEISHREIEDLYLRSDLFISLGGWEGVPTSMLEAMWYGLPCIMFGTGGIPEVIENGHNGIVLPDTDPVVVAKALQALIQDPEHAEALGKNAQDTVRKRYLWKETGMAIIAGYERLMTDR